jgi:membrane protein implicated in regulation of membrane protease activity
MERKHGGTRLEVMPVSAWLVWLVISILLIIAEVLTFTFYLLWLGIGALAGMLVAIAAPDAWLLQLIVAGAVAIILTYTTKPFINRLHGKREFRDPVDELVGKEGEVVEDIGVSTMGIVRIGTETWSATADTPIPAGEKVVVKHRGTAVVHVTKAKGDEKP